MAELSRHAVGSIVPGPASEMLVRLDYRRIAIVRPAELRRRLGA